MNDATSGGIVEKGVFVVYDKTAVEINGYNKHCLLRVSRVCMSVLMT